MGGKEGQVLNNCNLHYTQQNADNMDVQKENCGSTIDGGSQVP